MNVHRPIDQSSASRASNDDPVQFLRSSPNPFSLSTHIAYRIDSPADVRLTVSDALGRTVRKLVDGFQTPGTYSVMFDAADLPRGMYLCRIDTRKGTRVMRMLLQR